MARATDSDVQAVIENVSTISMTPFIATATLLTDRISTADTDSLLSSAELTQIEIYLAAYLYAIRDPQKSNEKTGKASQKFQGTTAMFFEANHWGQTAMLLDVTGYLTGLNDQAKKGPKKVGIAWGGVLDQRTYAERFPLR